ncbi:hypothetical protein ACLOJK_033564 [Asimina triloba]
MFNDEGSELDVLVASDAVGMGLNLNISRIIFSTMKKFDGDCIRYLTVPEIKQIAGRAGRYGSKYPFGEVTCLSLEDLPLLHSSLESPSPAVERAGLFPTYDLLSLYSRLNPKIGFRCVLEEFLEKAKLSPNYFITDYEEMLDSHACGVRASQNPLNHYLLNILDNPVDMYDDIVVQGLVQFARSYAKAGIVRLKEIFTPERLRVPSSQSGLKELESVHKVLELYVWLSYRLEDSFPDRVLASSQKSLCSLILGKARMAETKAAAEEVLSFNCLLSLIRIAGSLPVDVSLGEAIVFIEGETRRLLRRKVTAKRGAGLAAEKKGSCQSHSTAALEESKHISYFSINEIEIQALRKFFFFKWPPLPPHDPLCKIGVACCIFHFLSSTRCASLIQCRDFNFLFLAFVEKRVFGAAGPGIDISTMSPTGEDQPEPYNLSSDDSSASNMEEDDMTSPIEIATKHGGFRSVEDNLSFGGSQSTMSLSHGYATGMWEYMKQIPIPNLRGSLIPFRTWQGLAKSLKQLYGQPLHYLTNVCLKQWDQARLGSDDEHQPLDTIIHPLKAEATVWIMEEVHRLTSSHHHLAQLWASDSVYRASMDPIFPHLGNL